LRQLIRGIGAIGGQSPRLRAVFKEETACSNLRGSSNVPIVRVFALSDIHIDYEVNANWIANVSATDYRDDVLILAGDVTDSLRLLDWCLRTLAARFRRVLFVPGNHDLWVAREGPEKTSLQKFQEVAAVVQSSGASMQPFRERGVSIVPLFGWYDYSFGEPSDELKAIWMDYHACRWPSGFGVKEVAAHFAALNDECAAAGGDNDTVITFTHFLPRIDLMPSFIPKDKRVLYPVLGATQLERQLRRHQPAMHVYGHSHVNRRVTIDGVTYINNAFGYPREARIASKRFLCIHES
jgi:3',5'-cyclic AMP phosphodiesterase CpdA